ncbi:MULTISPECIES: hypothetical protein [Streptomyces]|uniref:hypothetical protein n=1 Tax=Streptomyces TaxID=1883 RepID=UPI00186B4431|nr:MULTISPECIES: hypothetical protein [Streptomyces]
MLDKLCQVGAGPASRTSRGWLFLLTDAEGGCPSGWPEGALSTKSPLRVPCAGEALRLCPRLTAPVAIRVRKAQPYGVFGGLVLPAGEGGVRLHPEDLALPYGHPQTPYLLAQQSVVELRRCTVVPLPRSCP